MRYTKRNIIILIILLIFAFAHVPAYSEESVSNVRVEQHGNQVYIYYDLSGPEGKYNVKVRGSSDGGKKFDLPIKSISGDIGKGVRPGSGNTIVWDATRDMRQLDGDSFVFEVEVTSSEKKKFTNSIGMKFVFINPDTFKMGSSSGFLLIGGEDDRNKDEKRHKVTLTGGFYIQTTEVTQKQWKNVMGNNPSKFNKCGNQCPVESVSWNDAQAFIRRLNKKEGTKKYRLPTEAEWEYACRAGSTTPFSFGECLFTDQANYDGNYPFSECSKGQYRNKTLCVASFQPNALGLYDMHGNVWEWCQDWYGEYPSGHVADPKGPSVGSGRVSRGGSWRSLGKDCRSAVRRSEALNCRNSDIGFRLVKNP